MDFKKVVAFIQEDVPFSNEERTQIKAVVSALKIILKHNADVTFFKLAARTNAPFPTRNLADGMMLIDVPQSLFKTNKKVSSFIGKTNGMLMYASYRQCKDNGKVSREIVPFIGREGVPTSDGIISPETFLVRLSEGKVTIFTDAE